MISLILTAAALLQVQAAEQAAGEKTGCYEEDGNTFYYRSGKKLTG